MAALSCVGIGETPVPQLLLPAFAPSRRWHRVARHARRDSNFIVQNKRTEDTTISRHHFLERSWPQCGDEEFCFDTR